MRSRFAGSRQLARRAAKLAGPPVANHDSSGLADVAMQLQRSAGNRAASQLLTNAFRVSEPGDPLERQADVLADQTTDAPVSDLPAALMHGVETALGVRLGTVRVHTGPASNAIAEALDASAFTVGNDIAFATGMYAPATASGRRLLAHELTHVGQGRAGDAPSVVHRDKKKKTGLTTGELPRGIAVPEKSTEFELPAGARFPWQVDELRAVMYPHREAALRQFLTLTRELDLKEELKGTAFTTDIAESIGADVTAERGVLQDELTESEVSLAEAQRALKEAETEKRQLLKQRDISQLGARRKKLRASHDKLTSGIEKQQKTIDAIDKAAPAESARRQKERDKRQAMVDEMTAELTSTADDLTSADAEWEATVGPVETREKELTKEKKELTAQVKTQKAVLKALPVPKKGRVNRGQAIQWRLREYARELAGLNHEELLGLVLDLFADDPDLKRFPKYQRYVVIHFSGMRYRRPERGDEASAHGSFLPPQWLLEQIKRGEVVDKFETMTPADIETQATASVGEIKDVLENKKLTTSQKTKRKQLLGQLGAVDAARKKLFKGKVDDDTAYDEIVRLEQERDAALAASKVDEANEHANAIEALEKQIGGKRLAGIRKTLAAAERKRREALLEYQLMRAGEQINELTEPQALGLLEAMKSSFDEWVWKTIVRRTQLRLKHGGADWDDIAKIEQGLDPEDPRVKRWKNVFRVWHNAHSGRWKERHAEDYQIVATSVVCNQLAEHVQHLRGVIPKGGISGKVAWYRKEEADAITAGKARDTSAYFVRAKDATDAQFLPGAIVFWAHFVGGKKPDKSNLARPLTNLDFRTDGGKVIRDGLVEGKWTYHIGPDPDTPSAQMITRTAGSGTEQKTEWYRWAHEATVFMIEGDSVLLFETSIGSRLTKRSKDRLRNPEEKKEEKQDATNVFLGWVPEGKAHPQLDEHLRNILGTRGAIPDAAPVPDPKQP